MSGARPRLIFFVAEDWFFCSHFLERAVAARDAGYEVTVLTQVGAHADLIRRYGFRLQSLSLDRRGLNPFRELRTFWQIVCAYRSVRPDLVHHVAHKPILYGTLAAKIVGVRAIVNAPVGMGYVFTSSGRLATFLRPLLRFAMRLLLNPRASHVVFENPEDLETMVISGLVRRDAGILIRGAGVDLERFRPVPEAPGAPVVTLVARMLWDKGVGEFVEAARKLRAAGVVADFRLVGAPDHGNPSAVGEGQLRSWHASGVIEWMGLRSDIPEILASSHVICLPSYREGLPKALLEALAAGRPIVATDVPGCREVVRHEENGLLVPTRNAVVLADALARLIQRKDLRERFGGCGRQRAEREFSNSVVCNSTLALYQKALLSNPSRRS